MSYSTIISPAELVEALGHPNWVIFDCRFNLMDSSAGWYAYQKGHIPGAYYVHLEEDLSSPVTPGSGRHPLPKPEQLADKLGGWGVDSTTQVVVYDDASGAFAARLWWLLRWLGHKAVAVLDGGEQRWREEGYPLNRATPEPAPACFEARLQPSMTTTVEDVEHASLLGYLLLDGRAPERFRGDFEPVDRVAGHIPGAKNHPFQQNLNKQGRFLPSQELAGAFRKQMGEVPSAQVVCMCGSGVTACHNLLAMEIAGFQGARLYPGSWSQWITDGTRPVAMGDETHD
ncbi:3-mercaptopyruvate sulfurtransferase [Nitrosococcus oceani ATCC 19707]|uniref:3-mercaptopyruvate sulfurtransferase n=2 Tax=Nitrosococcus oceani TaxID=1229 RepID=Q3JDI4_NITOC|nr:sulfurtransferase [Nitrosococcus oceani]ABA57112.1 3-mercaptopyruvate sulfurtransferase [Nitrosococcus oceani ATCC 19707]EDZ65435.1 rhodanese-like domain protein [Nitrosococcus oceani AFC27]KFI20373.1 3-mercaptopyruvate sulfurtransferase [Nitrosococcus oceani C-27]GEM19868.1 sulfurtransferase [Nitrosococcus oceani]